MGVREGQAWMDIGNGFAEDDVWMDFNNRWNDRWYTTTRKTIKSAITQQQQNGGTKKISECAIGKEIKQYGAA